MCFKEGWQMTPIEKKPTTVMKAKVAPNNRFYSKRNLEHLRKAVTRLDNGRGKEHDLTKGTDE